VFIYVFTATKSVTIAQNARVIIDNKLARFMAYTPRVENVACGRVRVCERRKEGQQ